MRRELGLLPCHSIEVTGELSRRRSKLSKFSVFTRVIDPSLVPIAKRVPSGENWRALIELEN